MEIINLVIGTPLGFLMWLCYLIFRNFGLAIVAFTLLIKLLMLPLNLWVQKNSIKMIRLKPALNGIEARWFGNRDRISEEQLNLYKKEHYQPLAGVLPMLVQIPLVLGIVSVVYHPLQHMLHLDAGVIDAFTGKGLELLQLAEAGDSFQLRLVELMNDHAYASVFSGLFDGAADAVRAVQGLDMQFLGIDLSHTPIFSHPDALLAVPLLAGASSWFLSWCQNRVNVLQKEANWLGRWGIAIFMTAFSLYFGYIVPAGVGLYWIAGNLFAIPVLLLCNAVYPPRKSIDYEALEKSKAVLKKVRGQAVSPRVLREQKQRAKADYKRFLDASNRKQVVFYSEKSGFYKYFRAIIDTLLQESDVVIHYVTSDPNDAVFQLAEPRIRPYYIDDTRLILLFMQVDADIMLMTMPDIQIYHLKRSYIRKDMEYIYVYHGVTNSHMVARPGCLDHYDTVLCVGPHQVREIRETEARNALPSKHLVECGYPLIEEAAARYESEPHPAHEKKRVVIAPSWQDDNVMDLCLDALLENLVCDEFTVCLRPHPQYLQRNPMWEEQARLTYGALLDRGLELQTDFSQDVFEADLLITDWSTIAYEYAFATKKPCLFINTPPKVLNAAYTQYAQIPVDLTWRDEVGRSISCDQLVHVGELARELLAQQSAYAEKLERMRQECLFHFGHSGRTGGQYVLQALARGGAPGSSSEQREEITP